MLYAFTCPKGHVFDRILTIARRDEPITCPECGEKAERQACSISKVTVDLGMPPWAPDWIKKTEKRVFTVGGG
jgi:putative FmdB family regulatory protein